MGNVEEIRKFFENIDEDKRRFAFDTIDEYCFFLEKIGELKKLPQIVVSPKNPTLQKITAAGKLIKEYSQVVDAKRSTLLRILSKQETGEAEVLLAKLSEFE